MKLNCFTYFNYKDRKCKKCKVKKSCKKTKYLCIKKGTRYAMEARYGQIF
jgi:hypothetical protein